VTRIWLFLLPIYLIVAASGIAYGLDRLVPAALGRHKSTASAAIAVALSLWLSSDVMRSRSV
jgi:hypothetical protein